MNKQLTELLTNYGPVGAIWFDGIWAVSYTHLLYVIDGVVCENMDFLNPMDIEKVDILKDASSTAIYGDVYKRQVRT